MKKVNVMVTEECEIGLRNVGEILPAYIVTESDRGARALLFLPADPFREECGSLMFAEHDNKDEYVSSGESWINLSTKDEKEWRKKGNIPGITKCKCRTARTEPNIEDQRLFSCMICGGFFDPTKKAFKINPS